MNGNAVNITSQTSDENINTRSVTFRQLQTDDPALVASVECYRWSPLKTVLFLLLSLLSLGVLPLCLLAIHRKSVLIRLTHEKCSLDQVTVFLAKLTFRNKEIIRWPALIATKSAMNDFTITTSRPSKGEIYKTLTPLNRPWLTFWQNVLFQDEFLRDSDSASAFKVHTDQRLGDSALHAGIDLGECGLFFWNTDRQIFQRLETPPPYFSSEQLPRRRNSASSGGVEAPLPQLQPEQIMSTVLGGTIYQQTLAANDANFTIELFRFNKWKTLLFYLAALMSGGLLAIVCMWKPSWRLYFSCDETDFSNCHLATYVKMTDATTPGDNVWIRKLWLASRRGVLLADDNSLQAMPIATKSRLTWRFFIFESMPFVFDIRSNRFIPGPILLDELVKNFSYEARAPGAEDYRHPWARRVLCGFNVTPVPLTPIWLIVWHEAFSPLYLFQFGCCAMWFAVDYQIYAICLLVFAFFTITWSVHMTYSNEHAVWHAVVGEQGREGGDDHKVMIISGKEDDITRYSTRVDARELLPGDIVFVEPVANDKGNLLQIPADMALMRGSCLVDESMLSGEVTPVNKFACAKLTLRDDQRPAECNILHSGTKLLTISSGTVGMVTSIGFNTTRGRLVRAVLRPTPADRRFTVEAMKFLGALGAIGFIGLLYSLIIRALRHEDAILIVVMCVVLISIIVPPQISVGLTIAQVIAQVRLKAKRIFCTNPKSVTPTGSVDLVCFDKTGTLTEETVKLKKVIGVSERKGDEESVFSEAIPFDLELCAACCNATTLLPSTQSPNNAAEAIMPSTAAPVGDPIDVELLQFSQFCIFSTGLYFSAEQPGLKIELVKNFGFSPERRSFCVVAKVTNLTETSLYVFLKGAPEQIIAKCQPSSIPHNINDIIADGTGKGLRLIALASKRIDSNSEDYEELDTVESEMHFLGIAFFENGLKPQTRSTITKLQNADLRCVMITGDDVRTALATARQCRIVSQVQKDVLTLHGMVDGATSEDDLISAASFIKYSPNSAMSTRSQFAITEDAWQVLRQEAAMNFAGSSAMNVFLEKAAVFARFRPDQKAEVVNEFRQRFGYIVAMVGDGANDCCALKAADVGIALTTADASIASAFTCKDRNISPVIDILKEGRCSLASTFGLFGVMVSYSCVQFCSACLLYWIRANCTDLQFLYIDLFLLTTLSLVFPLVPAFHGAISVEQPNRHLLSFNQIAPIIAHNVVNVAFQVLAFLYVQQQPWFLPYNMPHQVTNFTNEFNSFEAFSLYSLAIFQYLWSAFVFARGAPFRSSFFRSYTFTIQLIILLVINHFIVLYLPEPIRFALKIFPPPSLEFRVILILIAYINLVTSFLAVRGVQETIEYVKMSRIINK